MMLEFRCKDCGVNIVVPEEVRDRPIVCYNCNSQQRVPEDARRLQDGGQLSLTHPSSGAAPSLTPPDYLLVQIGGGLLIALGVIAIILSVFLAMTQRIEMMLGVVNGILLAAGGALLFLFRDMAIDLWHIRRRS